MIAPPQSQRERQTAKVIRIGFLGIAPAAPWAGPVAALRARLRDLDYIEGKNIVIEWRWAEKVNQLPELAAASSSRLPPLKLRPPGKRRRQSQLYFRTMRPLMRQQAETSRTTRRRRCAPTRT